MLDAQSCIGRAVIALLQPAIKSGCDQCYSEGFLCVAGRSIDADQSKKASYL
jgi:hypothetical protein